MLDKIYDILGSSSLKLMVASILLIVLGLFFLEEYKLGNDAVCNGAKFVIERNQEIEYNLRKNGQFEDATKLHKSLFDLANRVDDCNFNLLKLLKRRKI